jgi:hypothetical protein
MFSIELLNLPNDDRFSIIENIWTNMEKVNFTENNRTLMSIINILNKKT